MDFSGSSYQYSVKVINRLKKSEYSIRRLRGYCSKFQSVHELKDKLRETLSDSASGDVVGYIEPGHGAQGKQRLVKHSDDLTDMYSSYGKKLDILLWCYDKAEPNKDRAASRKRPLSPANSGSSQASKRESCSRKIEEVEKVLKKLQDKHGSDYSVEKLNAWAHLIQMGKHGSYDSPPDLPYFKRSTKGKTKDAHGKNEEEPAVRLVTISSPVKRLAFRTECIEQLSKWHTLLERGGITQQQYDEVKGTIMSDMGTFK